MVLHGVLLGEIPLPDDLAPSTGARHPRRALRPREKSAAVAPVWALHSLRSSMDSRDIRACGCVVRPDAVAVRSRGRVLLQRRAATGGITADARPTSCSGSRTTWTRRRGCYAKQREPGRSRMHPAGGCGRAPSASRSMILRPWSPTTVRFKQGQKIRLPRKPPSRQPWPERLRHVRPVLSLSHA